MLKRTLLIALCLAFSLVVTACDDQPGDEAQQSDDVQQSAIQTSEYYDVSIPYAGTCIDSQGGEAIVFTFEFTNKTNTPINFIQAVPTAAVQDGVALGQDAYVTGYTGTDGMTPDFMLKVEPGATATVHMAFALRSRGNVLVRCSLGYVDGTYPDMTAVLAEQEFAL